jgi:hypothetical protein
MKDLLQQFRYLIDIYESTGDMSHLFELERELGDFLDTVVDDYLEETNYDNVSENFYVQNIINWVQNHTRE